MSAGLEIRGAATGLFDDPLLLRLRGGAADEGVVWRARYRDDHGRVWRAEADSAGGLSEAWESSRGEADSLAALQSLRPLSIDVRAETTDGRACNRTLMRSLLGEGVRVRRWRDGITATLYLPAQAEPSATVLIDATAGARAVAVASLAAPLLASRGVLALLLAPGRAHQPDGERLAAARERLSAVPGAVAEITDLAVLDPLGMGAEPTEAESDDVVVLPPGVGVRGGAAGAARRAGVWDGLLGRLGAQTRASL
jgi:hypothetical protein